MKTTLFTIMSAVALTAGVQAGEPASISAKQSTPAPEPSSPLYEAGRGLITLEGPSGMFINPTSATLPAGAFTGQYCFFLPDNSTDPWGHGLMLAYGLTDWLEIGAIGNLVDADVLDDPLGAGPLGRIRLTKDEGLIPQIAIGGYGVFGDAPVERYSVFGAAYKRIPIDENGFVKSLGLHAGVRQTWQELSAYDSFNVYGGLEIQLPLRLYLVGEVSTRDDDSQAETPYAFGVQWRAAGINISVAGVQQGNQADPGFYFGIGTSWSF